MDGGRKEMDEGGRDKEERNEGGLMEVEGVGGRVGRGGGMEGLR